MYVGFNLPVQRTPSWAGGEGGEQLQQAGACDLLPTPPSFSRRYAQAYGINQIASLQQRASLIRTKQLSLQGLKNSSACLHGHCRTYLKTSTSLAQLPREFFS